MTPTNARCLRSVRDVTRIGGNGHKSADSLRQLSAELKAAIAAQEAK